MHYVYVTPQDLVDIHVIMDEEGNVYSISFDGWGNTRVKCIDREIEIQVFGTISVSLGDRVMVKKGKLYLELPYEGIKKVVYGNFEDLKPGECKMEDDIRYCKGETDEDI